MKTTLQLITATMLLTCVVLSNAEENASVTDNRDKIFNSMMQTMPDALKNRVDSASKIQTPVHSKHNGTTAAQNSAQYKNEVSNTPDSRLDLLPENIRLQVLKAMKEIELDNSSRIIEFKEQNSQK